MYIHIYTYIYLDYDAVRFTTETDGKLRQGVRRQVGNPAAEVASDGASRRARRQRPLLRDPAAHRQEPSLGATGK